MKPAIFSTQRSRIQQIIAFITILSVVLMHQPAQGAVELVYFKGNVSADQFEIQISWKTSFEQRTAEYFITRKIKDSPDDPQVITVILDDQAVQRIPASQNGVTGSVYEVSDPNIVEGATYEYSLWEREFNNSTPTEAESTFEILATAQQESSEITKPTETPIPTITPTSASGNQSTTPTPVATQISTSTPVSDGATPGPNEPTAVPTDQSDQQDGGTAGQTETQPQPTVVTPTATIAANEPAPTIPPTPTQQTVAAEPQPEATPTEPAVVDEEQDGGSDSGIAEAGELPQDGTYPEPESGEGETDQSYVPPEPTATFVPIDTDSAQQIGSNADSDSSDANSGQTSGNVQAVQQATAEEISQSRIILWGGFISSLLLFFAVLVATLYMYRQRNSGG